MSLLAKVKEQNATNKGILKSLIPQQKENKEESSTLIDNSQEKVIKLQLPIQEKKEVPSLIKKISPNDDSAITVPTIQSTLEDRTAKEIKEVIEEKTKEELFLKADPIKESPPIQVEHSTEEIKNNVEEEENPEITEEQAAVVPKKRRGRQRKTKVETDKESVDFESESVADVIRNTESTVQHDECMEILFNHFISEEWSNFEQHIIDGIKSIAIGPDPTPAVVKDLLSQISIVRDEIYPLYAQTKALYEHFTGKDGGEGFLNCVIKSAKGSNTEERRANGIKEAASYKVDGETINLFEQLRKIKYKFTFMEQMLANLKCKNDTLITMSSMLKIDNDLSKFAK